MYKETSASAGARFRTLTIIWAAFLSSVVAYLMIGIFVAPQPTAGEEDARRAMLLAFTLLSLAAAVASFALKKSFLTRAATQSRPDLAQTGYVVAFALSETACLFGLVALFVTASPISYLMFAVGGLAILLHRPRREHFPSPGAEGGLDSSMKSWQG